MLDALGELFYRGGPSMWAILAASVGLWYLALVCLMSLRWKVPGLVAEAVAIWQRRRRFKMAAEFRREALLQVAACYLKQGVIVLEALVQILPLLGLLGTVLGMIKVFDVLAVFGIGNARAMAAGISEALITTLAGLVTSLVGLYLVSHLKGQIQATLSRLALKLS